MAIQTLAYLKTKFETGDKPTQQDFYDLLDTMFGLVGSSDFDPENINTFLRFVGLAKWIGTTNGTDVNAINFAKSTDWTNWVRTKVGNPNRQVAIDFWLVDALTQLILNASDGTNFNQLLINPNYTETNKPIQLSSELPLTDRKQLVYKGYLDDNIGSETFTSNPTLVLSGGKTYGKYVNGSTPAWTGLTPKQAILDALVEYIAPVFSSFSISGQATTLEVGTTISESKTFVWGVNANSGVVPTITIKDITNAVDLVVGTPNDGTQAITLPTTIVKTAHNATHTWRGVGNNTSPSGTFNSGDFTVTWKQLLFHGALSASVTNSATARAMPANQVYGAGTFNLNTGSSLIKFGVCIPNASSITSVVDLDALNVDITSQYVLIGTITVQDAGGNNMTYKYYEMNQSVPYSSNHRHSITIS